MARDTGKMRRHAPVLTITTAPRYLLLPITSPWSPTYSCWRRPWPYSCWRRPWPTPAR